MSLSTSLPIQPTHAPLPESLAGRASLLEALYVHVPFCTTKCHYCDFYSVAGHMEEADAYLDALARELALHRLHFGRPAPRTLFIGGGTPTLLSPRRLERLLEILRVGVDEHRLEEFTVESNPDTLDADKARILAGGGVNRMSFGVQSFHAGELAMLQRDHDPAAVAPAFAAARAAGIRNLNLDLIFGIPGQTPASWDASLSRALELEPSHLSCYSLIYEPNTAMTARLRRGELRKIDEETELTMFERVYARLQAAGFCRYETSNYARVTSADGSPVPLICQHNLIYWQAGNWLGVGPSAGSHVALPHREAPDGAEPVAWQWKNAGSLAHYVGGLTSSATHPPITQMEALNRTRWAAGAAVFWLRLDQGLNFSAFEKRLGINPERVLREVLGPYVELGFAEITATGARITERGVAVSDHILKRVLAAMEASPPPMQRPRSQH